MLNSSQKDEQRPLTKPKPKCLIANDEPMSLYILEQLFIANGFDVSTARNGHEAFELVQETLNSPAELFDLIVLDLNMPIADGYEACSSIIKLYQDQKLFGVRQNQKLAFWDLKPVIVACTSFVNAYVIKSTEDVGF